VNLSALLNLPSQKSASELKQLALLIFRFAKIYEQKTFQ
jgi:hypothetical protein